MNIKAACVYCGSSSGADGVYADQARQVGTFLGKAGIDLVYGGGRVGLMGIVADAAMAAGGKATGIIPAHIADREVAHTGLTDLKIVDSMHRRKQMMVDMSDAFIILPGGFGTMDEFFEIFTWWQLGLHDKPVIVVNSAGYWDPLIALIDHIIARKFAKPGDRGHLCVIGGAEDLPAALELAPTGKNDPKTKWM